MAILADDEPVYTAYAVNVAAEFLTVFSPLEYKAGREKFLKGAINKPHLFQTDFYRAKEEQARENMAVELDHLDDIMLAVTRLLQPC